MKKELEEKLYVKYPNLFKQRIFPPIQSSMYWGICCGDGWYDLLDKLCKYINKNDNTIEIVQVKEKFGGLRVYVNHAKNETLDKLEEFERLSYKICEECGSTENVKQTTFGWTQTLCKKCIAKKEKNN